MFSVRCKKNQEIKQLKESLNPHANTTAAVKMNEINPKYENT
jgi:Mg2+ and Co2+ transporter CorA